MGQIPENPELTLNRLNVSCEIGNLKQRKQDYIMLATQNGVKKGYIQFINLNNIHF